MALAVMAATASCNLDLKPFGSIDQSNAISTVADADKVYTGLYISFRGSVAGTSVSTSEIQTDLFHATTGFGNNGGYFYRWDFQAAEGECATVWAQNYSNLKDVNFLIDGINKLIGQSAEDISGDDLAKLDNYLGEAHFLRAYYHMELVNKFCEAYDPSRTDQMGIPYITVYEATADRTKYPERGTLTATLEKINADLDIAEEKAVRPGKKGSIYITEDAVKAFRARVYLYAKEYAHAAQYALALIRENKYPLVSSETAFRSMWVNDSGEECIMQTDASYPNDMPSSYDYNYFGYNPASGLYQPYYIPEKGVLDLFRKYPDDLRLAQFFEEKEITVPQGSQTGLLFAKFPGNPALRDPNNPASNYAHKQKPFRIAEMYLILAESYAELNSPDAVTYLNALRSKRIPNFSAGSYSDIRKEIRDERIRELIGEGFRLNDLKRWNLGLERTAPQINSNYVYEPGRFANLNIEAGNHRFVWPIPTAELDANPQIQQNPGY